MKTEQKKGKVYDEITERTAGSGEKDGGDRKSAFR